MTGSREISEISLYEVGTADAAESIGLGYPIHSDPLPRELTLEEAVTPGLQFDVQARRRHLIPVAIVVSIRKDVSQMPGFPAQFFPWDLHAGL